MEVAPLPAPVSSPVTEMPCFRGGSDAGPRRGGGGWRRLRVGAVLEHCAGRIHQTAAVHDDELPALVARPRSCVMNSTAVPISAKSLPRWSRMRR